MITVHHLLESRSERVIWLLEELGQPYELLSYRRETNMEAPAAYRALHPMGTSPIMRDDDLTMVETGAIIEYLLSRYGEGRLAPERGTSDHALYLQWMHFAEGSAAFSFLTEGLLGLMTYGREPNSRQTAMIKLWRDRNQRMIPYLDDELGRRPYFAGEAFTAADIMMSYTFGLFDRFVGLPLDGFANISRYRDTIAARPAFQKSIVLAAREPT